MPVNYVSHSKQPVELTGDSVNDENELMVENQGLEDKLDAQQKIMISLMREMKNQLSQIRFYLAEMSDIEYHLEIEELEEL